MTTKKTQYQTGFTIVEMLVSLAVFSIVVTITIGALLMLIASNRQLQVEQSIMTNLSFVLDGMTREIRTGKSYFCSSVNSANQPVNEIGVGSGRKIFGGDSLAIIGGKTNDCASGFDSGKIQGLAFKESGNSITGAGAPTNYIMYFFDKTDADKKSIYRKVGSGPAEVLQASDIEIVDMQFFVVGSDPLSAVGANVIQPTVTIRLKVKEKGNSSAEVYTIQTTITQRELDL